MWGERIVPACLPFVQSIPTLVESVELYRLPASAGLHAVVGTRVMKKNFRGKLVGAPACFVCFEPVWAVAWSEIQLRAGRHHLSMH